MSKKKSNEMIARAMKAGAEKMAKTSANSRCMIIYHQPRLPEGMKKYRKF